MEYEYIVLSGGAAKGLAYIGVLEFLEKEQKVLKKIKEITGCSIGAFAGLLIFLGYKSEQLKNILKNFNLDLLKSFKIGTFFQKYGLDNGDKIQKFIKIFIKEKNFDENVTLKDFYEKTQKKLITVVTNVNTKQTEYISLDTFPDMPVFLAVQMSMTIPFIFQPIKYNDILYVDGGLTCNFPVRYYHEKLSIENQSKVLCFCFDEKNKNENLTIFDEYLYNILKSSFNTIEKIDKNFAYKNNFNIITIPVNINTSFNLQLSDEIKTELYKSGYDTISLFFDNKIKDFID